MNKGEKIGQLRERIRLERVTESRTTSGAALSSWQLLSVVWAAVEYRLLPSTEAMELDRETATNQAVFTIRTIAITEKDRIIYRAEVYDITAISYDQTREFMRVTAELKS